MLSHLCSLVHGFIQLLFTEHLPWAKYLVSTPGWESGADDWRGLFLCLLYLAPQPLPACPVVVRPRVNLVADLPLKVPFSGWWTSQKERQGSRQVPSLREGEPFLQGWGGQCPAIGGGGWRLRVGEQLSDGGRPLYLPGPWGPLAEPLGASLAHPRVSGALPVFKGQGWTPRALPDLPSVMPATS